VCVCVCVFVCVRERERERKKEIEIETERDEERERGRGTAHVYASYHVTSHVSSPRLIKQYSPLDAMGISLSNPGSPSTFNTPEGMDGCTYVRVEIV
jgi:hypothetical protein